MADTSQNRQGRNDTDVSILLSEIAAMAQLLDVYEKTAIEQSDKMQEEILERKMAEAFLIEEKNKSEAIIAAIGDGITIQDRNYKIIYQNRIAINYVGSHVGEYCYKAYEGMEQTCEGCPVALAFEDGKIHTVVRRVTTDKGILYFENTASALKDAGGNIVAGIEIIRDITGRKKIEDTLRESEKKYKDLFDSSQDGIYKVDERGVFTLINQAGARLFGYDRPEEIIGKKALDYWVNPEDRKIFIDKLMDKKFVKSYPMKAKKINGEVIYIESSSRVLEDEKGNFIGIEGILRDVTERKEAEEGIRNAFEMTHQILDKAPFGIFLVDADGNMDYVNPAMLSINNDTYGLFMGINAFELPTYVEIGLSENIRGVLAGKPFFMGPIEYISYYGKRRTVRNFIGIPYEEAGKRKALVFVENVTEFHKLLTDIERAKVEWEATFDSANEFIVLVDKDFSIARCNKSFGDFAGRPCRELVGLKFMDVFELGPEETEYYLEKIKKEEPTEWAEIETKDGRWFYVSQRPVFDEKGGYLHSVIIATDISHLKNAQVEVARSEKELKRKVADLEKFYETAIDRELKMKEMKKEIRKLNDELADYRRKATEGVAGLMNAVFPESGSGRISQSRTPGKGWAEDVFDEEAALASVDGEMGLLGEVVEIFFKEYPSLISKIRSAIDEGDISAIDRASHTLKGLVGNFGARAAFQMALQLETMGKGGDLSGAREELAALEHELERLKQALRDFTGRRP